MKVGRDPTTWDLPEVSPGFLPGFTKTSYLLITEVIFFGKSKKLEESKNLPAVKFENKELDAKEKEILRSNVWGKYEFGWTCKIKHVKDKGHKISMPSLSVVSSECVARIWLASKGRWEEARVRGNWMEEMGVGVNMGDV